MAIEIDSAVKMVIAQLKLLALCSHSTADNVLLLLNGIRLINQVLPSCLSEIRDCLSRKEWLKTHHGHKTPSESILSSSKWAAISLFIDLPPVDDSYYGTVVREYDNELKLMGVITDLVEGAVFVARGLKRPIESGLLTAHGAISLVECIKYR